MVPEPLMYTELAVVVMLSFLLAAAGAAFMSRYAYHFGLIDIPNNRSSHDLPTPRGGGIGILLAFTATSLWLTLPLMFWLPAVLLSLISFFDDKLSLTPKTRMISQFAAAIFALLPITCTDALPAFAYMLLLVLCPVFIVGTANFYNFMDGINGIAGISGLISFSLLAVFALVTGQTGTAVMMPLAIAAACAGFLPLNLPRAKVFMGDVGSILLGFLFAVCCVTMSNTAVDFLVCCGFLATFYADALYTLFVRYRDGERLSQAHRRHVYQLLANQLKIPHWKVSAGYGACQLILGILFLIVRGQGIFAVMVVVVIFAVAWLAVSRVIRRRAEVWLFNA